MKDKPTFYPKETIDPVTMKAIIGYNHVITKYDRLVGIGGSITEQAAELLLEHDLETATRIQNIQANRTADDCISKLSK